MEEDNKAVQETAGDIQPQEKQTQESSFQETNLALIRRKLEAEERARIEAERRSYELEQKMHSYQSAHQQKTEMSEEDELAVDNDDYVQAKHIKTSNKKFSHKLSATDKRIAELEQKYAYIEAKSYTDTLKDFEEIVSEENVKTLARLYPEDYEALQSTGNLRVKSKTAYNMIKNYGIYSGSKNSYEADQRISSNNQKPKLASTGSPQTPQTPLTRLDEYGRRVLSEADRDRILLEVERKKMGR